MSGVRWTFDLQDASGNPLTSGGLVNARNPQLTVQQGAPDMFSGVVALSQEEAVPLLSETVQPYIVAYRDVGAGRVMRFNGPVWVDEIPEGASDLAFTAMDPTVYLRKRFTTALFSGVDLGTILRQAIDTTNTVDGDTGIETSPGRITASSAATVDGTTTPIQISSLADQFEKMLDGVEAWTVPIDNTAGKIAQLYAAPRRGTTNTSVVFGYGAGTAANCSSMGKSRNKDAMENDIRGDADGLTTAQATSPTSIGIFRRLVSYVSFTGETNQTVLDARTVGRLIRLGTLAQLNEYRATPGLDAPALWDDFDIGDTVTLDYSNTVEWTAAVRIMGATLAIGDGGDSEKLTSLAFAA